MFKRSCYWTIAFTIHPIQVYPTYLGDYVLCYRVWINSIVPPSLSLFLPHTSLHSSDSLSPRCAPLWPAKGRRARERAEGEHVAFDTPSRRSSRPRLEVWIIGPEERRPLSNGIRAWRQQRPVGGREKRNPQISHKRARAYECSRSLSPGDRKRGDEGDELQRASACRDVRSFRKIRRPD